jgi:ribosome-binding protein aMBF1 (putative translation factor)
MKKKAIQPRPLLELLELADQREQWNRQVGESLRRARVAAGLSQQALARTIDASQAYVSQVEHGKGVSSDQLRLFVEALEELSAREEHQHEQSTDEETSERQE